MGELYLVAIPANGHWYYRIDYPYYSWAETVVRPRILRRDFSVVLNVLNENEPSEFGSWKTDNSELTSAVKFVDNGGTLALSALDPHRVADVLATQMLASSQATMIG